MSWLLLKVSSGGPIMSRPRCVKDQVDETCLHKEIFFNNNHQFIFLEKLKQSHRLVQYHLYDNDYTIFRYIINRDMRSSCSRLLSSNSNSNSSSSSSSSSYFFLVRGNSTLNWKHYNSITFVTTDPSFTTRIRNNRNIHIVSRKIVHDGIVIIIINNTISRNNAGTRIKILIPELFNEVALVITLEKASLWLESFESFLWITFKSFNVIESSKGNLILKKIRTLRNIDHFFTNILYKTSTLSEENLIFLDEVIKNKNKIFSVNSFIRTVFRRTNETTNANVPIEYYYILYNNKDRVLDNRLMIEEDIYILYLLQSFFTYYNNFKNNKSS
ncbi:hypothetical protein H8356DRAFT_1324110 [Neocallimastix lanati (nom. inval.)]|nr:hypothetical protein H8356DRAFT_1324110 [Neocallimastix sp. JGI-2020a]